MFSITEKLNFLKTIFGNDIRLANDGFNVSVRCPFCAQLNKKTNKQKLIIRADNDLAHCWVCGYSSRSLLPLLMKLGLNDKVQIYKDKFYDFKSTFDYEEKVKSIVYLPSDFNLLSIASSSNQICNSLKKYLISRDIDEHDMWYYKLGYSNEVKFSRRVIIPSFNNLGVLNYYTARAIDESTFSKYENATFPKTEIIFNELNINWNKPLIVCEGPFDLLKCEENATCLLGSELNENHLLFEMIIKNKTPVILSLDSDMNNKSNRMALKLLEYDISVKMIDLGKNHDPGSMSKTQFSKICEEAKSWNWETSFKKRLDLT